MSAATAAPKIEFDRAAFAAAIGPKHAERYLQSFERIHDGDGFMGWHWPALFTTTLWLLYRKLYLYAFVYLVAGSALPAIVALLVGVVAPQLAGWAYFVAFVAVFVAPALFADALYHRGSSKLVAASKTHAHSRDEQLGWLAGKGGTSSVAPIAVGAFLLFPLLGVLSGIALPAYHDYALRAKAGEAIVSARAAMAEVDRFHAQNGRFPASAQEAGIAASGNRFVTGITVDPDTGTLGVAVTLDQGTQGRIVFTRRVRADNSVEWSCHSPDLAPKVLPSTCRAGQSGSTISTG